MYSGKELKSSSGLELWWCLRWSCVNYDQVCVWMEISLTNWSWCLCHWKDRQYTYSSEVRLGETCDEEEDGIEWKTHSKTFSQGLRMVYFPWLVPLCLHPLIVDNPNFIMWFNCRSRPKPQRRGFVTSEIRRRGCIKESALQELEFLICC